MVAVGDQASAAWANYRPVVVSGSVSITPSAANTPTSQPISFPLGAFTGTPNVQVTANTSVPGVTVTGVGVTGVSSSGATLWVTRGNTTATALLWIAVGT